MTRDPTSQGHGETAITVHVRVDCTPDEAFAFLSNYENDPSWRTGVETMRHEPAGPAAVGTRTFQVIHFLGRIFEIEAEVTEIVPGERIVFRTMRDPLEASGYRAVAGDGGATRVTYHVEARLTGLMQAFSPLVMWAYRRRTRQDLQRLRTILESASRQGP